MAAIHSATQLPPPGLAAAGATGTGASNTNDDGGGDDEEDEEDEAEEADEENEEGPDDQEPMKFIWFNDLYVLDSGMSTFYSTSTVQKYMYEYTLNFKTYSSYSSTCSCFILAPSPPTVQQTRVGRSQCT